MATVVRHGDTMRIQFKGLDDKRRTLYAGKISARAADDLRRLIEAIIESADHGVPLAPAMVRRLDDLGDDVYAKLVGVGLVNARAKPEALTLGPFVRDWIEKRNPKTSTAAVWGRAEKWMVGYFRADCRLSGITEADAEDWQRHLEQSGLAEATRRKMCGVARQMFKDALKAKRIESNPFLADGIKTAVKGNAKRSQFITMAETEAVLAACPNAEWRVIVALSRYGGLRCPSETLALKWADIDWDKRRVRVPAPKTAHLSGKGERFIPLFPELASHLEAAFDAAPMERNTSWASIAGEPPTCGRRLKRSSSGQV